MQRMARPEHGFLIVEGDSDSKFFKRVTDPKKCSIVRAYSWPNAVEVLSRLKGQNVRGVLCILDADFRRVEGGQPSGDVLWTDAHDLEMELFGSPALERV